MSKGHGATQRAVLGHLSADWTPILAIADRITDPTGDTRAERATEESVRRAAKRLAAEGLIELKRRPDYYAGSGRRYMLCARSATADSRTATE